MDRRSGPNCTPTECQIRKIIFVQFIENQRIFYKKVWEISGFNDAVEEYMDDLKGSISSKFIDVQEDVEREVNGALEDFGKQLKKAIDEKLTQLKQYV